VPLINLTLRHGRTLDDAKRRLELAVERISGQSGALVKRIEWSEHRERVKLHGVGFWAELWVDAISVYATGDIPVLGSLLGSRFGSALRDVLEQAFPKKLP